MPTPPTPKPPRSRLGGLVISVLLLVLGVVALIDLADNSVPGEVYVAAALATVGLGLVIGAWIGRARGLIALGIVLSLGLGLTAGVDRVHNDDWGHMGNIEWRPHNVAEIEDHYRQGAGDTRLDLSNVDFAGQDVTTRLTTRAGNVTIILPDKVDAVVNAKVFAGNAEVLGEQWEGLFTRSAPSPTSTRTAPAAARSPSSSRSARATWRCTDEPPPHRRRLPRVRPDLPVHRGRLARRQLSRRGPAQPRLAPGARPDRARTVRCTRESAAATRAAAATPTSGAPAVADPDDKPEPTI
ncbi:LiaF domain-containing protein [Luedemannella flava]